MERAQKMTTFEQTVESLCDRVEYLLAQLFTASPQQRIMIALAGVPGSGKSTVCAAVLNALSCRGVEDVSVVPMVSKIHNYKFPTYCFPGWLPLPKGRAVRLRGPCTRISKAWSTFHF